MTPMIAKIAWVLLAVGWYVLRIPHERRAKKTPVAFNAMDVTERTRLLISITGLGIFPFLYVIFGFPAFARRDFSIPVAWLGVAAAIAALAMFHLTHKALGRNWSVSLQMRQDHKLITDGVYRTIRHPMYTAFWLMAVAQALLLPNWVGGLSGILGFGTLYLLRVRAEEDMMVATFGEEYRQYMTRTGRLFPKLF